MYFTSWQGLRPPKLIWSTVRSGLVNLALVYRLSQPIWKHHLNFDYMSNRVG